MTCSVVIVHARLVNDDFLLETFSLLKTQVVLVRVGSFEIICCTLPINFVSRGRFLKQIDKRIVGKML